MTFPHYYGVFAALLGGLLIVSPVFRFLGRKITLLSHRNVALLEGDERKTVQSLLESGKRLPWLDLLWLYWNSRDLLGQAHGLWIESPEDAELSFMLELEEEAHARTRRNLRLHVHERIGVKSMKNATQVYALFLLDSFGYEMTVIEQMKDRLARIRAARFKGAF